MRPRLQRPVRWLLLLALTAPLAAGVAGIGDRQAGATSGSPAAVAVNFALRQLGKPYRWGGDGPAATTAPAWSRPPTAPPGWPCRASRASGTTPAGTSA